MRQKTILVKKAKAKDKLNLRIELKEIAKRIKARNNKVVLDNYYDLKRMIEINQKIYGIMQIDEIMKMIDITHPQIYYLMKLDELKDKKWIDKLDIKIILFVLNYNDKTLNNQDKYFQKALALGNLRILKLEIEKEFSQNIDDNQHLLEKRFETMCKSIENNLSLYKTIRDNKIKMNILKYLKDINEKIEEIFNENTK